MTMFEDVSKFHVDILDLPFPDKPKLLDEAMLEERFKFLHEELDEFHKASMHRDLVGATDGLLDLVYVALGTLYIMGVPADRVWKFVQDANMQKVRGITSRGNKVDAVKPPGWQKPDTKIEELLAKLVLGLDNADQS